MNGWWKFHRKMLDHAVCKLPHSQRWVWIVILNSANITNNDWFDGRERITIEAGSFITSQQHLADMAGVTRQVIRDALTALQKVGSIRTKIRTKHHTQITVVNWPYYQGSGDNENQDENQPRTNREPSENQVRTITEEGKKERKKKQEPELPLRMTSHQAAIASYLWTFEREYHTKPPITAAEAKAAKDLSSGRTPEESAWIVFEYLTYPSRAVMDKGLYSLRNILYSSAAILAKENKHKLPTELLTLIGGTNGQKAGHVQDDHGSTHPKIDQASPERRTTQPPITGDV